MTVPAGIDYVPNLSAAAREHHQFWTRQTREHLLFLSLMLTDPELRARAKELHERYTGSETATRNALAWQRALLDRLRAGEFLGFAYPLFVDHITRETMMMLHLVWGDPLPWPVPWLVTVLGAEHAEFGAHLLDPSQDELVKEANAVADALYTDAEALQGDVALGRAGGAVVDQHRLAAADKQRQLAAWLKQHKIGHGGAPSIVSPVLADHVVREQGQFDRMLREGT